MRYGIKHNNGNIEAITKFKKGDLASGFDEITEAKYNEFLQKLKVNRFSTYDSANNQIVEDNTSLNTALENAIELEKRQALRQLSIELDLMTRLGEDTTAKLAEFNTLKIAYQV